MRLAPSQQVLDVLWQGAARRGAPVTRPQRCETAANGAADAAAAAVALPSVNERALGLE
jgi:hypothetical protein